MLLNSKMLDKGIHVERKGHGVEGLAEGLKVQTALHGPQPPGPVVVHGVAAHCHSILPESGLRPGLLLNEALQHCVEGGLPGHSRGPARVKPLHTVVGDVSLVQNVLIFVPDINLEQRLAADPVSRGTHCANISALIVGVEVLYLYYQIHKALLLPVVVYVGGHYCFKCQLYPVGGDKGQSKQ